MGKKNIKGGKTQNKSNRYLLWWTQYHQNTRRHQQDKKQKKQISKEGKSLETDFIFLLPLWWSRLRHSDVAASQCLREFNWKRSAAGVFWRWWKPVFLFIPSFEVNNKLHLPEPPPGGGGHERFISVLMEKQACHNKLHQLLVSPSCDTSKHHTGLGHSWLSMVYECVNEWSLGVGHNIGVSWVVQW